MKNIKEIFKDSAELKDDVNTEGTNDAIAQKRKMYCPICYEDVYTYENTCPKCGALLEESLTEEERAEYVEMLMNTRL